MTEGVESRQASGQGCHVYGSTHAQHIPKPKMQAPGEASPILLESEESQVPRRANSYR